MCLLVVQALYFCVGFWELSSLTCDLSQAEKKITDKMTFIFTQKIVEIVILSDNNFVSCLAYKNSYFLLSVR